MHTYEKLCKQLCKHNSGTIWPEKVHVRAQAKLEKMQNIKDIHNRTCLCGNLGGLTFYSIEYKHTSTSSASEKTEKWEITAKFLAKIVQDIKAHMEQDHKMIMGDRS
jgi:hypothetical protein